jgi:hypothetical protein
MNLNEIACEVVQSYCPRWVLRNEKVPGTCEEIGFTDFSTTHFQRFPQLKIGPNSIFSHVPDTFFTTDTLFFCAECLNGSLAFWLSSLC